MLPHGTIAPPFAPADAVFGRTMRHDDSTLEQGVAEASDVRAALDAPPTGRASSADQKPSVGSNIKWAPGNAPAYLG